MPASVTLNFVEVIELHPPKGATPIHWLLLTTHQVASPADAWRIVTWYKRRWIIEQFFRTMKSEGLRIEDSRLETAERLMKLIAVAAKAAIIVIQLVQARDGGALPAGFAFRAEEIEVLDAINKDLQGKIKLQKNPHRQKHPRLVRMDHRQARRLERICFPPSAGPYYHAQWPRPIPSHRPRLDPQKCVDALAHMMGG